MAAPRGSRVPLQAYYGYTTYTTEATLYLDKVTVSLTLTEPLSRNFMQYTTQTHRAFAAERFASTAGARCCFGLNREHPPSVPPRRFPLLHSTVYSALHIHFHTVLLVLPRLVTRLFRLPECLRLLSGGSFVSMRRCALAGMRSR
jgi:hypothetical protein